MAVGDSYYLISHNNTDSGQDVRSTGTSVPRIIYPVFVQNIPKILGTFAHANRHSRLTAVHGGVCNIAGGLLQLAKAGVYRASN